MVKVTARVVVAGDMAIDWLQYPVTSTTSFSGTGQSPPNWTGYANTRMMAKPGGAMLLAEMVRAATGAEVVSPKLQRLESIPPDQVIHANASLGLYPASSAKTDEKNLVYRVKEFHGYSGPDDGSVRTMPVTGSVDGASLIIFDDAGNGFRDDESLWRGILGANPQATILLKMSRPLMQGKLWNELSANHCERLVVVIGAGHLRECGVTISRCLSWERTAQDFVRQMRSNKAIQDIAACSNLIVLFGPDAALHHTRKGGSPQSALHYDPKLMEDGFSSGCPGGMYGLTCAFTASLASRILAGDAVEDGIGEAIGSSQRLYRSGFGKPPTAPDWRLAEVFGGHGSDAVVSIAVPEPVSEQSASWTILSDLARTRLETAAFNTVTRGSDPLLERAPIGKYGNLEVIDRTEIESYQSIRNLMVEYVANEKPERPLSIAVFGPPGAGKSFGVTELANSIAPGKVEKIEFNISQFESGADLVNSLHRVRDVVLQSNIPLVFFDEFDSQFGDQALGWLKYFLMPMQDGKFKHGQTIHPIGKAIFVFAGGTSHKFSDFYRDGLPEDHPERKQFAAAKGPDFVSRLRGYVNILGPNPVSEDDRFYMIRRAMLLRFMLRKNAGWIFDESGEARIDPGVLCAMIKVPRYRHGVRSLLAIIDMSRISDRRSFEQSALPPRDQLELHVDSDIFTRLMLQDVIFGESLEKMAAAIHEKYRKDNENRLPEDDPAMLPWDQLRDDLRDSNRRQARQVPRKLQAVNCGMFPVDGNVQIGVEFTAEEVEFLAKMEHEAFVDERISAGWKYGKKRDDARKTRPSLVPWEKLPEAEREKDRESVRGLPEFLATAGFEIYRLP